MSDSRATSGGGRGLRSAVDYIARVQRDDGLIPWYPGGPADPWDHVEAAMGLTVGGRHDAAVEAYRWLADTQRRDGSWWAVYDDAGASEGSHRETHRSAYVATGVWHHYLATGDRAFLDALWPTVDRALSFATRHQRVTGEIPWAVDAGDRPTDGALVTGCSSLAFSFACGSRIADALGYDRRAWARARRTLSTALDRPSADLASRWLDKDEFAMDWFYPVLSGIRTGDAGRARLEERLEAFVEPGLGCRCDRHEAWVTVAETAELAMTMQAVGRENLAADLYDWAGRFRDAEGVFWTGYQFVDDQVWPAERPTWTSGAMLLAADALENLTPAAGLFTASDRP